MRIYTIYFGTSLPGGGDVTPPQWAAFVGDVVVPALPDGFTVLSGEGVWRDPVTGATIRERAQVLTVAAPLPSIAQTVDAIRKAYRVRFDQQSVGLTIHEACAEF